MKIVFTPDWFLSFDVLIEIFSFLVLIAFFMFALRSYKLNQNKKALFLGIGFFLIAFAEIFTIFTKLVLYYDTIFTKEVGQMIVTYHFVNSVDIFYYLGFFFHKLLTLSGLYLIYKIPSKKGTTGDFILAGFFIIISAIFSSSVYFVFHIIAMIILFFIVMNYVNIYKKTKFENTKTLIGAFAILLVSQIVFLFSSIKLVYAIGQILQLVSYIIMLILIYHITKHGKKKKSHADSL